MLHIQGFDVKTTNEVLAETGLTYPMFNRLKDLGIVPKPRLKGQGRRKGVVGVFEDDVIDTIHWVKLQQKRGFTISEIAEQHRRELVEIEVIKPTREYLIPLKSDPLKSYLNRYSDLHSWLQGEIEQQVPGYELFGVDTEIIIKDGEEFLKPRVIKVRPMTK